ncbi:MAG TPA: hypothetical protein VLG40_04220 [Candidatus Saccharimonas sp.]|nr:hypothetical protein [Candidatus Saccharimonas sp.]
MGLGDKWLQVLDIFACLGYTLYLIGYNAKAVFHRRLDGEPMWRPVVLSAGCLMVFACDLGVLLMQDVADALRLLQVPILGMGVTTAIALWLRVQDKKFQIFFYAASISCGLHAALYSLMDGTRPWIFMMVVVGVLSMCALAFRFKRYFDSLPAQPQPNETRHQGKV